ncbi:hypothetical protein LTS14_007013 [Recurvomyces mirabilis]|uniref:uncharacterized protein n=1 Tax=Recurvomyces mirabilis TaxID=574656 RepID=UPI002DE1B4D4|nr:hypothetical protein LTS14_007013 [Recurvomyces mirabilis]
MPSRSSYPLLDRPESATLGGTAYVQRPMSMVSMDGSLLRDHFKDPIFRNPSDYDPGDDGDEEADLLPKPESSSSFSKVVAHHHPTSARSGSAITNKTNKQLRFAMSAMRFLQLAFHVIIVGIAGRVLTTDAWIWNQFNTHYVMVLTFALAGLCVSVINQAVFAFMVFWLVALLDFAWSIIYFGLAVYLEVHWGRRCVRSRSWH